MVIIGSTAIKHWFPESRDPKDFDVFSDAPVEGAEVFWHPRLAEWCWGGNKSWLHGTWTGAPFVFATHHELYTLKVSHSYWELNNGSWTKHIEDAAWLKKQGCRLIPELHSLLYKVWEETHGSKRVDLTMESNTFFADAVVRKYDHDSLHESVAYDDEAQYIRYLKPGSTVQMDMAAIKAASFEDQVKLFREEVYATALERRVIPSNYTCSPRAAYAWALRRTITSLTKGWSARFLVENFDTFRAPDVDYVARHRSQSHKLIPLEA